MVGGGGPKPDSLATQNGALTLAECIFGKARGAGFCNLRQKIQYFIRKNTYSTRKFDIIDTNKWLI